MEPFEKINYILEEVDKFNARIDEGMTPKEKKSINNVINKPKNQSIKLMDQDVKVTGNGDTIKFTYDNNDNITFALVDIADARGLEFNQQKKGKTQILTIEL